MTASKTQSMRGVLTALNYSLMDRVYQQVSSELGLILTFHHVKDEKTPDFAPNAHLSIRPQFLDAVIKLLKYRGFDIISLDEARKRIVKPDRSSRFAVLTFDDGYKDTLEQAVPVLQKHDVPYTVYIAPGLIDKTADLWWAGIEKLVRQQDRLLLQKHDGSGGPIELDCSTRAAKQNAFNILLDHLTVDTPETEQRNRVRELCWLYKIDLDELLDEEMMTWDQVKTMIKDPLCTLGAHTLNHQALARLTKEEARNEVINGASVMEMQLGEKPKHFAFPYGYRAAAADRDFEILKALRFKTAVTTRGGMVFPEHKDHLTALPRISVNGHFQSRHYVSTLATGLPTRLLTQFRKLDVK